MDIQPNNVVLCTATKDSTVYLGGQFTKMGNAFRNYFAAFDLSTGQMTDFNPSFDNPVSTICVGTTKIAFGGYFKNVSYKGTSITNVNGFILYNIAEDAFETPPVFVLNDPDTYPAQANVAEIVYHAGTGVFYIVGGILVGFTDYNGIYKNGITAAFGILEDDGGLIDLGIRKQVQVVTGSTVTYDGLGQPVTSPTYSSRYAAVGCNSCLISSDSLYLGVQNSNNITGAPAAFNIASVNTIAPISTWDAVFNDTPTKMMGAMDGNIWMYRPGNSYTYYKSSAPETVYTVGHFLIVDPVNAIPDVATSGLNTSTFTPYGGNSMGEMWEDASYVYMIGGFWGIGLTGFNPRNSLGGIARISKPTYAMSSEAIDLRYYTPGGIQYFTIGSIRCRFTHNNDVYTFGFTPQIAGSIRPNPYAPYIINPDFSKKQYAASLLV